MFKEFHQSRVLFVALASFTIPSGLFADAIGVASNYNALIFGSLSGNSGDVEGRLAVSGNATFPGGYSVGTAVIGNALPPSSSRDDLLVGGNFSTTSNSGSGWTVNGDVVYGGTLTGAGVTHSSAGASTTQLPGFQINPVNGNAVSSGGITFSTLLSSLQTESANLAALVSTPGTSVASQYTILTMKGTNSTLNVFNLTASQWDSSTTQNITAPVGSTVVINISGNVAVNGGAMTLYGVNMNDVLFNLSNAATFSSSSYEWDGSILAPNASTVSFNGGDENGVGIFSGNVTQNGGWEWHNFAFDGSLVANSPEPGSLLLAGLGIIALGLRLRKHDKRRSRETSLVDQTLAPAGDQAAGAAFPKYRCRLSLTI